MLIVLIDIDRRAFDIDCPDAIYIERMGRAIIFDKSAVREVKTTDVFAARLRRISLIEERAENPAGGKVFVVLREEANNWITDVRRPIILILRRASVYD